MDGDQSNIVLCEEGITEKVFGEEWSQVQAVRQHEGIHLNAENELENYLKSAVAATEANAGMVNRSLKNNVSQNFDINV